MANKKIEDIINKLLTGDAQKNALDLVAHLQAAGFTITQNDANDESGWAVADLGFIVIMGTDEFPGPWSMWLSAENLGEKLTTPDESLKQFAWANVAPCGSCGGTCTPGTRTTIFGKVFENPCQHNLMFTNPDAETVAGMKKNRGYKEERTWLKSLKQARNPPPP